MMSIKAQKIDLIKESATVAIADRVKRLQQRGQRVVDLSAGRAFEPTPAYVSRAAMDAVLAGDTHQTMAQGTSEYRKACAIKLWRDNSLKADWETEIIATAGVKQALTLALLATLNPGDEVLVEDPCFVSYAALVSIAGGVAKPVALKTEDNFRWTADQLEDGVGERTRAILLNSPQNPTGTVHTRKDLEVIAETACTHDLIVVTDEVYERLTWGGRSHICIASLPGMRERTVTCMGLTKSFSMGGWRIGFIFAPAQMIDAMTRLQAHLLTCTSSFIQAGAAVALREPPHAEMAAMWREWEARCKLMTSGLNQIPGFRCVMPEGAFYAWVDITGTGYGAYELADKLINEGQVAVVPGPEFGKNGEGFIRINCVRNRDELSEGLERIRRTLV